MFWARFENRFDLFQSFFEKKKGRERRIHEKCKLSKDDFLTVRPIVERGKIQEKGLKGFFGRT